MVKIDEETIQKFKNDLRGELIRPGYDDTRKIWNAMINDLTSKI